MKYQSGEIGNILSSIRHLITTIFLIVLFIISDTVPAESNPPGICHDVAIIEKYANENIPREFWQNEHCMLGAKYDFDKNYQQAIVEYRTALKAEPNSAYSDLIRISIGDAYAAMQEYDKALADYDIILGKYPNSVFRDNVHYNIAVAHFKKSELTAAKNAFLTLIDEYPNSIFVPCARQNIQSIVDGTKPVFLTESFQDSAEQLKGEVELYEKVLQAFTGGLNLLKKETDFAQKSLNEINIPSRKKDRVQKGMEKSGQVVDKRSSYRVIELYGNVATKNVSAFKLAEEFLEKYPESDLVPSLYYTMVSNHYSLLNIQKAAKVYQRMKAAVPADNSYLVMLRPLAEEMRSVIEMVKDADGLAMTVWAKERNREYAAVATLGKRFLAKFPQDGRAPEMQMLVGDAYFYMKKYNQARWIYEKFIEMYPDAASKEEAEFNIGKCYVAINEWQFAEQKLKAFLTKYPKSLYVKTVESELYKFEALLAGADEHDCNALKNKGNEFADQGRNIVAMEQLQLALGCYKEHDDLEGKAKTLNNIARLHLSLNNYEEAEIYLSQAQALFDNFENKRVKAVTTSNFGLLHYDQGDYRLALEYWQLTLPLWKELYINEDLGATYVLMGMSYKRLGDYEQAVHFFENALSVFPEPNKRRAFALCMLGASHRGVGEYESAFKALNQSLTQYVKEKDDLNAAMVLHALTGLEIDRKNYPQALLYSEQKTRHYLNIKDYTAACESLHYAGSNILGEMGEYEKALKSYHRALVLSQEKGLIRKEAFSLKLIGDFYSEYPEKMEKAINYYQQAVDVSLKGRVPEDTAEILAGIAGGFSILKQEVKSIKYYKQALLLWQEDGNKIKAADTLANIASCYKYLGDTDATEKSYKQALRILESENTYHKIDIELQLASLYAKQGYSSKARKVLDRVLPFDETIPNLSHYKSVLFGRVSLLYMTLGDFPNALDYLNRKLKIYPESGKYTDKADIWYDIGFVYENLGDLKRAKDAYLKSVEFWEKARNSSQIDDIKTMLADSAAKAYGKAIIALMAFNEFESAFNMTERARVRSILNQSGRLESSGRPDLIIQERKRRDKLRKLEDELQLIKASFPKKKIRLREIEKGWKQTETNINAFEVTQKKKELLAEQNRLKSDLKADFSRERLEERLQSAYLDYEATLTQIKLSNWESQPGNVLSCKDLQQILPADTTLLVYFAIPELTFAFVITNESFHAVPIPVTERDIEKRLANLSRAWQADENGGIDHFQHLYKLLFQPVREYINTSDLYIIPHGVLHYIPFSALHDGKRFLLERYTMANLSNASALFRIRRAAANAKDAQNIMLALCQPEAKGNDDLSTACMETKKVADMFGSEVLLNHDATETVLKQQAASANYIHIVSHGEFKPGMPLISRMFLTPDSKNDGLLEVPEIFNLHLSREIQLITLTGCETSMPGFNIENKNVVSAGDEIISLNRAFISAGAPSVLASLWRVEANPTSELMLEFYKHIKQGYGKGDALRCAQANLQNKGYGPFFWASFILTGDIGSGQKVSSCMNRAVAQP